jgi:WD40 repeat protein
MVAKRISSDLSQRHLTIIPNFDQSEVREQSENQFTVKVTNNTKKFLSFQLRLRLPQNTQAEIDQSNHDWYRVEPQASAKKPPGSSMTFQVTIVRPPIPTYDRTLDLDLQTFSVEAPEFSNLQRLRLYVAKPRAPLSLKLLANSYKTVPGQAVEISTLVYNCSSKTQEVTLHCFGLNSEWFPYGTSQIVSIEPGFPKTVQFICQLPDDPTIESRCIPFEVRADVTQGETPIERATLEVLSVGEIKVSCQKPNLCIPRDLRNYEIIYECVIENQSNTASRIELKPRSQPGFPYRVKSGEDYHLEVGDQRTEAIVVDSIYRPWFGGSRRYQIKLEPQLFLNEQSESAKFTRIIAPETPLSLKVLPMIPLWLQWLSIPMIALLIGVYGWINPRVPQQGSVNIVHLNGVADTVLTGASDGSVRTWTIDVNQSLPQRRVTYRSAIAESLDRGVQVLRLRPKENDEIALGFENGKIQIWDLRQQKLKQDIFNSNNKDNDKVFSLEYTSDSQYLFSGHGSGAIHIWDLQTLSQSDQWFQVLETRTPISTMVLQENQLQQTSVYVGGQYNQLLMWHVEKQAVKRLTPLTTERSQFAGQNRYINSIVLADQFLITGNNQGQISVLDTTKVSNCEPTQQKVSLKLRSQKKSISLQNCSIAQVDQWLLDQPDKGVRAIALTKVESGNYYLAAVGDSGQVKLWQLNRQGNRISDGHSLEPAPNVKLRSVDIKQRGDSILVVTSNASDSYIRLYSEPIRP